MDGQRATVKEVGGTMYQLQAVQKTETGFFRCQVDGEHSTCRRAKLLQGEGVVGIVFQPHIVDLHHLTQLVCQPQGVAGLTLIAHVERFQSQRLHIGGLRRHVGPQVEEQLIFHPLINLREGAIVNDESAQRGAATREILGA